MYQLKGKASMWWDQLLQVQHIRERDITWKELKRYFQRKYLTKIYYDKKMKEFFELKLDNQTIDEYEQKFLELLKYVPFIKDESVKIHRYLSGLPHPIVDKIQYDDPPYSIIKYMHTIISIWSVYVKDILIQGYALPAKGKTYETNMRH
jgi:hypothetical protein